MRCSRPSARASGVASRFSKLLESAVKLLEERVEDYRTVAQVSRELGNVAAGPALNVAQSYLGHFGVGVGEVRRRLRGSVLSSVDLV